MKRKKSEHATEEVYLTSSIKLILNSLFLSPFHSISFVFFIFLFIVPNRIFCSSVFADSSSGRSSFSQTLQSLSILPESSWVQEPVSKILYDIHKTVGMNFIACGLDKRITTLHQKSSTFDERIKNLLSLRMIDAISLESFTLYLRDEDSHKSELLETGKLEFGKKYPRFSLSYHKAPLSLVLERVMSKMEFPCKISNKIQETTTLHLKDANSFEVFYYLIHSNRLRAIEADTGQCLILPKK